MKIMGNIVCRNCRTQFIGDQCPQCGYNMNINNPMVNIITYKNAKEQLAEAALAILASNNLISMEKDLKHLVVEFGYLLSSEDGNKISTLLKVIIPKRMFKEQKTFYLGTQDGKLIILNENFNETMFRKVSNDMLTMHRVDLSNINSSDYIMELY